MDPHLWLGFVLAASIILIIPGPTIILVVGQSLSHGRRAVLPLVAGVALGDLTAMTASLGGLGVVMATSAALFTLFKWVGALYLLYLGVKMWLTPVAAAPVPEALAAPAPRALFRNAFVVTALNPKSIAFFVAFLPQFVRPGAHDLRQLLILGATFLVLAIVNAALYGLFAGQLREVIATPRARRTFNRLGGSALIGAGLATVMLKRASS